MDIAAHITFFFVKERLIYLKQVVQNLQLLPYQKTIFIYSNVSLDGYFSSDNIINIVSNYRKWNYHRIGNKANRLLRSLGFISLVHPFYLSWENRKQVEKIIDKYDVQIYLEDDIVFNSSSFEYWLNNKDICLKNGFNLGFLRIEIAEDGRKFITDISAYPSKIVEFCGKLYLVNEENPYCGFWIYDKKELTSFIKSKEWNFRFGNYEIREKSAIGWHGKNMNRYKATVIPLLKSSNGDYITDIGCYVHHLPNNYIGHNTYCKVRYPIIIEGVVQTS
jgi:hypothetical protein